MFFGVFSKKAVPPLTALCFKASGPNGMLAIHNTVMTVAPTDRYKRALVLHMLIMLGAGELVGKTLEWKEMKGMWQGSRQYMADTDLDLITAEAIIWLVFIMGQLWKADQKTDRDMFHRVGFATISQAGQLALGTIKSVTGVASEARFIESRKLYVQSIKSGKLDEAFATVVAQSVGCRSLLEYRQLGPVPPPEFTPLALSVRIFLANIPAGLYDTYKNILREHSSSFPHDDDLEDDHAEY